ncbi:MAG: helix-turn-helix domain-containing protein, partial [Phenylobacterium sp.]
MAGELEFIGTKGAHAQAGGFSCGHWIADVWGEAVTPHGHDEAHLILVTGGNYETRADGDPAGAVLVYNPPGLWHADRFVGGPGSSFTIAVSPQRFAALRDLHLPHAPTRLNARCLGGLLVRAMRAACTRRESGEDELTTLGLELMGAVAADGDDAAPRSAPPWLDHACQMLRDREPAEIDAVSAAVGVHPVHLARTFRRVLRCTPGEYRLAAQVEAAATALARTRAPLCEIALDAGFADQSHFTRRFG